MAKKARRRAEEEEADKFEFPVFDETGFLAHEFEQFHATLLAFVLGVGIGVLAFLVGTLSLPFLVPFALGLLAVAVGAYGIRQIRPAAADYTKGDWASLIILMFFGFLGVWLLLADVLRSVGAL